MEDLEFTIYGSAAQMGQLAVTIRDGLEWQRRDAAEDGLPFDPEGTFDAMVARGLEEKFT